MRKNCVWVILGLFLSGLPVTAAPAAGPAKKNCRGGVIMRANFGATTQGSLLLAEVSGIKNADKVTAEWAGRALPMWQEAPGSSTRHTLLPVDLEKAAGSYEWRVSWIGESGNALSCSLPITVRAGKFPTERLTVEKQYVEPNPEQIARAEADQKKMRAIYDTITPEILWKGKFALPLRGDHTGKNFGRRRILNGEPRSPHTGVDFPAADGTPVYASQAGKVVLAENLYYSGNTVVVDHGFGIYTLYAHLSEMEVHLGEFVAPSAEIGKVGATGRVTGPHLHWGLTIDHARVNALQIVQREP